MSFGMYRPTMGVAGGHRELVSNQSLHKQRVMGEQMRRQDINPITGEPMGGAPTSDGGAGTKQKQTGCLGSNLVPNSGPLDHMTVPDKDVPSKRVDPTKNQSTSFQSGVSCLAHENREPPRMQPSRITDGQLGDGFCERRTPTPEGSSRRSTPGQVVRSNTRPKDNLSGGGCVASDKYGEHPLNLPRKAGSAAAGIGSGGSCHIFQGPNGFVPMGPENFDMPEPEPAHFGAQHRPFQRACGVAAR